MEIFLIVFLFCGLFVTCIYLIYVSIQCQAEGLTVCATLASIITLVSGVTSVYNIKISNIKSKQYNYKIQYNDTTYYTNDYILSNGGIEFEAEEGHFIFPVEGQELKINKTKKGDQ